MEPPQNQLNPYNFFFHPFQILEHEKDKKENLGWAIFAIFTHTVFTLITIGLWQIPFWAVNYFENRKVILINKEERREDAERVEKVADQKLRSSSDSEIPPETPKVEVPRVEVPKVKASPKETIPDELIPVLARTNPFNDYRLSVPASYGGQVVLTGTKLRPSNLFLRAIFGKDVTTMPGGGLFRFVITPEQFKEHMNGRPDDEVVSFSAKGVASACKVDEGKKDVKGYPIYKELAVSDLSEIYGDKVYSISYGEIKEDLRSQKIYTAPLLPAFFYADLKQAMIKDKMTILPGDDSKPVKLGQIDKTHIKAFMAEVAKKPTQYGFQNIAHFKKVCDMTVYQIGALVVKTEDYHVFLDDKAHIRERKVGEKDAIRLVNGCGIRGINAPNSLKKYNSEIMKDAFLTMLQGAEDGYAVFPAVGMGIWRGDPELYWSSFLDAVVEGGAPFDNILVNPNHQPTISGQYKNCTGNEFQGILNEYIQKHKDSPKALENLGKIINLSSSSTDLVQLACELRKEFPDKNVSLVNASDPDVTFALHVTEYTNNYPHTKTTEENYSAMGSNLLCFETHTGVHEDPSRIFQVFVKKGTIRQATLAALKFQKEKAKS